MKTFAKTLMVIAVFSACHQAENMTTPDAPQFSAHAPTQAPRSDVRADLAGMLKFEDKYCVGVTQDIVRCFGLLEPGETGLVPVTLERDGQVIAHIGDFEAIGKQGGQTTYAPSFSGSNGSVMWVSLENRAEINIRAADGRRSKVTLPGVTDAYHGVRLQGGELVTSHGTFDSKGRPIR